MFIPKDDVSRCIASLIYVNETNVLFEFCNYVTSNPKSLQNDMLLLGDFCFQTPKSFYLPNESVFKLENEIDYLNHVQIGGICDAAAIGQYLFGIDPRNSRFPIFNKFKNENLKCDLSKCSFRLSVKENHASINDINLYNIHIHSKIFNKIVNYNWTMKLIERINLNKRTFIKYNFL